MSAIPINFGRPWSPYFVFIKNTHLTDRDFLAALGLKEYVLINSVRSRYDYIAIGRDPHWTHVADNFGYSHWASKAFKNAIARICMRFEVFTFSVGESDMSFDFDLYRDGQLIRHSVWEDRYYSGGRLQEQTGSPLEFEDAIPVGKDPLDGLWRVASALGIESDYSKLSMTLYAPTLQPPSGPFQRPQP